MQMLCASSSKPTPPWLQPSQIETMEITVLLSSCWTPPATWLLSAATTQAAATLLELFLIHLEHSAEAVVDRPPPLC